MGGYRRQDLIRFGKFGEGWTNHDASESFRELFLIPQVLLDLNPFLNQNPGYDESSNPTFTVNSTGDGGDSNLTDLTCDDGSGDCTLRAAIEQANDKLGADNINFDIPGTGPHTITPATELPIIFDPVVIDGTTEPDFNGTPMVELDGSQTSGANGLWISANADNSTIRGLVINGFADEAGIHLGASWWSHHRR